jgi:hypothetical protein
VAQADSQEGRKRPLDRCPRHPDAGSTLEPVCKKCRRPVADVAPYPVGFDVGFDQELPLYAEFPRIGGQPPGVVPGSTYSAEIPRIGANGNGHLHDSARAELLCSYCQMEPARAGLGYYCSPDCNAADLAYVGVSG